LADAGVLERHHVRVLGTPLEAIRAAEDRELFKQLLIGIGEPVPESATVSSQAEARAARERIGLPLVVHPAFTLGGTGGGICESEAQYTETVAAGLAASPIGQVLVERSLVGWRELEYEVMRDAAGTCITVCNMENIDPMGVHTGDSIVVAPSQTLSDRDHQMLRSAAIRIIRALSIEGGCNVQFALDPASSRYYVIEVNPRVSRSSALASKATGYPIARVAAKVAVGLRLDEVVNQVTGRTGAAFEPALDYCVVKIPRWPFDKFPAADRELGTQMKSTGEVMAIERTFEGALLKALRALEQRPPESSELADARLLEVPCDRRLAAVLDSLRRGVGVPELARRTLIDPWFLERMREAATAGPAPGPSAYKMVDTCAGEFEARTPYFYSCRGEEEDEADPPAPGTSALVVGSGPIRIGQGIEFDYCSVHAAAALREAGVRAVMVNSNPETVSTDFDTSDRLYFEPLDTAAVAEVARHEAVRGVFVQFGGQTSINLAEPLAAKGVAILGSTVEAIDLAEDRRALARELESMGIPQPPGAATTSVEESLEIAARVGYPVLVRPSYVLGGRAMEIVRGPEDLERYMGWAVSALPRGTVLVDRYLEGVEVEVDAVSDGETVVIPGVMQHVERAGVHSGDSFAVYPALGLEPGELELIVAHTVSIARRLSLRGLVNVQYVVHEGRVHVLEVNPRASRTVPFLSKVTGVPMVRLAARVMLGESLSKMGWETGALPAAPLVAVKAPVFSMNKLASVDSYLGPEMKSTGEVMGVDRDLSRALQKAFLAAGVDVRRSGDPSRAPAALLTIADRDKEDVVPVAEGLRELGFALVATAGTAAALRGSGLAPRAVGKIGEVGDTVMTAIVGGEVDLVVNTMSNVYSKSATGSVIRDGFEIRRAAVERRIPCLTSLDTAAALVESAAAVDGELEVRTLTEWRRGAVRV
ncbi:MAG: carbamoyl-phosphate synthase large subunit, partial [Candidatus Dormibacterales bacterium]